MKKKYVAFCGPTKDNSGLMTVINGKIFFIKGLEKIIPWEYEIEIISEKETFGFAKATPVRFKEMSYKDILTRLYPIKDRFDRLDDFFSYCTVTKYITEYGTLYISSRFDCGSYLSAYFGMREDDRIVQSFIPNYAITLKLEWFYEKFYTVEYCERTLQKIDLSKRSLSEKIYGDAVYDKYFIINSVLNNFISQMRSYTLKSAILKIRTNTKCRNKHIAEICINEYDETYDIINKYDIETLYPSIHEEDSDGILLDMIYDGMIVFVSVFSGKLESDRSLLLWRPKFSKVDYKYLSGYTPEEIMTALGYIETINESVLKKIDSIIK